MDRLQTQAEPVAIAPLAAKKVKSDRTQKRDRSGNTQQHQNGNTNKLDVPTTSDSPPISIQKVRACIKTLLLETWQETGFGKLTVESERESKNIIRITVKGSTYYRFFVSDEDVSNLVSRKSR